MKKYLVIHQNYQVVAEAENASDLEFKYPETVIAVIALEEDTIKAIKNDDYVQRGSFA